MAAVTTLGTWCYCAALTIVVYMRGGSSYVVNRRMRSYFSTPMAALMALPPMMGMQKQKNANENANLRQPARACATLDMIREPQGSQLNAQRLGSPSMSLSKY